ncbi:hypothetical protein [Nocardioides limicola]|uniref:hypothetical protein n=1 Tax=Nocardioides limicola TaxID=2803368 RepID=UPI00193B1BDE|nr:hypothetical protein [Nocardioides sp. DJM-14]
MSPLETFFVLLSAAGLLVVLGGMVVRHRRIHAEHWLWKRRRLQTARLLLSCGAVLFGVGMVALLVVEPASAH